MDNSIDKIINITYICLDEEYSDCDKYSIINNLKSKLIESSSDIYINSLELY